MKAVAHTEYGGPDVLRIVNLDKPVPGKNEVLVKVHAASINSADRRLIRADPFLVRLDNGLRRPKNHLLGIDIAGTVEEVGPGATRHALSDAVFGANTGHKLGGFAEYVSVSETAVVKIPETMTFEEAAAVPLAGITALQAVRDRGEVQRGRSVLVHGAGGGVGTAMVQIAKAYGAVVTAVCGPNSTDLVRSLGADHIVDYTAGDFTAHDVRYDVIFGINGYHSLAEYKRLLNPKGIYVMVGGKNAQIFEALLLGRLRFAFTGKRFAVLTIDEQRRQEDLLELRSLLSSGRLKPVVDRVFPLQDVKHAFAYVEEGHIRGKVILKIQTE